MSEPNQSTLLGRLRDVNRVTRGNVLGWEILDEAADEIERLEAVIDDLRYGADREDT